mgnify:CR=1 FL=1
MGWVFELAASSHTVSCRRHFCVCTVQTRRRAARERMDPPSSLLPVCLCAPAQAHSTGGGTAVWYGLIWAGLSQRPQSPPRGDRTAVLYMAGALSLLSVSLSPQSSGRSAPLWLSPCLLMELCVPAYPVVESDSER